MIQEEEKFSRSVFPHRVIIDGRLLSSVKKWSDMTYIDAAVYEHYMNGRIELKFSSESDLTKCVEYFGLEDAQCPKNRSK